MNRRNFFASLAALGAAATAPGLFLPKLESVRWKRSSELWIPNPAYAEAPFELSFVYFQGDQVVFKNGSQDIHGYLHPRMVMESVFRNGSLPPRYHINNDCYELVPPFIKA